MRVYRAIAALVLGGGDERSLATSARGALRKRPREGLVSFTHCGRRWFARRDWQGVAVLLSPGDGFIFLRAYGP